MQKSLTFCLILATIALTVVSVGCTSSTNPTATPANPSPSASAVKTDDTDPVASIDIRNFAYQPSEVTVKKGTTVKWVNDDSVIHTVTSSDGRFTSSGDLGKDATHQAKFNTTGSYDYYCIPHPFMKGKVIVEG